MSQPIDQTSANAVRAPAGVEAQNAAVQEATKQLEEARKLVEQEDKKEEEEAGWETLDPSGYRPGPPRNHKRKAQEDNEVEGKEVSRQAAGDEREDNPHTDKRGVIHVEFAPPKQLRFGSARGIGSLRDLYGY